MVGDKLLALTASDLGMDRSAIQLSFANHVEYTQGRDAFSAKPHDFFHAIARAVRDRMFDRWNKTQQSYVGRDVRRVYYLSLEYLTGRLLGDALLNLGILEEARAALAEFSVDLEQVLEVEHDPGLGNGGLGRLAACFLDSMATVGIPAMGYGLRYEYGIFSQAIVDGNQVERADTWLRYGSPWEVARPNRLFKVRFGGRVHEHVNEHGRLCHDWVDTDDVMAMAYDILVPGFRNDVVNTLRLWAAKATRELDLSHFNQGDYVLAITQKNASENISRVLYPGDAVIQGKELRLRQEYFFVSATLQDAVRRHLRHHPTLANLHEKAVFQLNDTHPTLAVPELMRVLVDEHGMGWEEAWEVTRRSFAYTNHTVLPEALETWPVSILERLLPRHLQLAYEINRRFLDGVRARHPGDEGRVRRMSLFEEGGEKRLRMANLAIAGSYAVNGVSALHSQILRERVFRDFAEDEPDKFLNRTNGVTPRRWLLKCNPGLSALITTAIGPGWQTDLDRLAALVPLAGDASFREAWRVVKADNKARFAAWLEHRGCGAIDPRALLDAHVKRIHEYKRQLLNLLHVISLYFDLKEAKGAGVPRTFLFAGKAAPAYAMAKRIIRLVHAVAQVVNRDPDVCRELRVVFVPDYSVSAAEVIIPAADVSEQISTAGMEASGTGNMKLAMNGALTVGTLDGANVEIQEAVGAENIFIFGLHDHEVERLRASGYRPRDVYEGDPVLRRALDALAAGTFSPDDRGRFRPIVDALLHHDPFFVLADFDAYRACQREVARVYRDPGEWTRRAILNVANMGRFSSDATIRGYAREIWRVGTSP